MTLDETIRKIEPLDIRMMKRAERRWDNIAKPLHSLGKLEDLVVQIIGITRDPDADISHRALVPMCADHGVVEEGVTQTGQEVTAIVAENFLNGITASGIMCRQCGTDLYPVDVGILTDTRVRSDRKVAYGTGNMAKGPAMTRKEAIRGIEAGIHMAEELKEKGYQLLLTGEMGIGNTTASSAVTAVLLREPVERVTGRGAGLSSEGLVRKISVIQKAIDLNQPDPKDPLDTLAKVGGLDIAGITGLFLGGAALRMPVLIDGLITCVGALIAQRLCPMSVDYMIPSHMSKEPAVKLLMDALGKDPVIHADLCLGEGTGAIALLPFLDMGIAVFRGMSTFEDIKVAQYEELK